jgi:hypothetical protein
MTAWMLLAADAPQTISQGLSWEAITAIVTIVGVGVSIMIALLGGILWKLSKLGETVAAATVEIAAGNKRFEECREHDREAHGRIFKTVEEHGRKLDDHEKRITDLEE